MYKKQKLVPLAQTEQQLCCSVQFDKLSQMQWLCPASESLVVTAGLPVSDATLSVYRPNPKPVVWYDRRRLLTASASPRYNWKCCTELLRECIKWCLSRNIFSSFPFLLSALFMRNCVAEVVYIHRFLGIQIDHFCHLFWPKYLFSKKKNKSI